MRSSRDVHELTGRCDHVLEVNKSVASISGGRIGICPGQNANVTVLSFGRLDMESLNSIQSKKKYIFIKFIFIWQLPKIGGVTGKCQSNIGWRLAAAYYPKFCVPPPSQR